MKNIRVLLADDEITILQGLKCIYDWEKNGFEIVGTALDGMRCKKESRWGILFYISGC